MVHLMSDMGYVSLDVQYIDGTKIESSSNRYTFVWKKSVAKYKEKLEVKIDSILKDIDASIGADLIDSQSDETYVPINSDQLHEKIKLLNQKMEELNKQQ